MRVLWVCNIMLPVIAEALHREASNKEGWLSGLLSQIVAREDTGMTLAVAFPVPAGEEIPQSFVVRVQGEHFCYGSCFCSGGGRWISRQMLRLP